MGMAPVVAHYGAVVGPRRESESGKLASGGGSSAQIPTGLEDDRSGGGR